MLKKIDSLTEIIIQPHFMQYASMYFVELV